MKKKKNRKTADFLCAPLRKACLRQAGFVTFVVRKEFNHKGHKVRAKDTKNVYEKQKCQLFSGPAFQLLSPPLWLGGTRVPPFFAPCRGGDVNINNLLMQQVKGSTKRREPFSF
jgi:hypothetical protein